MDLLKKAKKYKAKESFLTASLKKYWFIPSDVLQRSIEANIWNLCEFKSPILEIGIGNGKLTNFLFKNHPQIEVGIDIEENGLKTAKTLKMFRGKKRYGKVICANAEKMPFEDASFNTIVSNSTFEHISDDLKAVSEVARVLKKDGLFFITVPSEYLQKWIFEYEEKNNRVQSHENLKKFNERTNHLHYRSLDDWKDNFKKNHLKILCCKYYLPKKSTLLWYKLFKISTFRVGSRETWSIFGGSKLTKLLPKKAIISLMKNSFLKKAYKDGFFVKSGVGAQLFMIAKKM